MRRCREGRPVVLAVLVLILLQAGSTAAQDAPTELPERKVIAWTNPILLVFGWYMVEGELRLQQNHTVGLSASFLSFEDGEEGEISFEDNDYQSVNLFYRYYPDESFKGFFIGGQVGHVQVDTKDITGEESGSSFSAGVLIGYGWLLGDAQRIGVSLGIGANRLFGGDVDEDANLTIPVIRLINVGIAF